MIKIQIPVIAQVWSQLAPCIVRFPNPLSWTVEEPDYSLPINKVENSSNARPPTVLPAENSFATKAVTEWHEESLFYGKGALL